MLIERCCTDSTEVALAMRFGAGRVELCRDLETGGLTPSEDRIERSVAIGLPVHVLIRPRGGDFTYTEAEALQMVKEIRICRRLGARGVVIGALDGDGDVDIPLMRRLIGAAQGMDITFHRAFDRCNDPYAALEEIISLGFNRILTSGQGRNAYEGRAVLAELVRRAVRRITIMPGGGVTPENIGEIARACGAAEFHGSRLCADERSSATVLTSLF